MSGSKEEVGTRRVRFGGVTFFQSPPEVPAETTKADRVELKEREGREAVSASPTTPSRWPTIKEWAEPSEAHCITAWGQYGACVDLAIVFVNKKTEKECVIRTFRSNGHEAMFPINRKNIIGDQKSRQYLVNKAVELTSAMMEHAEHTEEMVKTTFKKSTRKFRDDRKPRVCGNCAAITPPTVFEDCRVHTDKQCWSLRICVKVCRGLEHNPFSGIPIGLQSALEELREVFHLGGLHKRSQ